MSNPVSHPDIFLKIIELLESSKRNIVQTINQTMVSTYFEIGRMIVEDQQGGEDRAQYGKQLLKDLSKRLTNEFGKGFSVENLDRMRFFYLTYGKSSTVLTKSSLEISSQTSKNPSISFHLSWSHYIKLMRIENEEERKFYEIESQKNNWSVRELNRQYDSALYTRLVLSRDKEKVKELAEKGLIVEQPKDIIKDPYILEFIGLPEKSNYSENQLEEEIINKLEHFLLELGNGFTFVARQKRIHLTINIFGLIWYFTIGY